MGIVGRGRDGLCFDLSTSKPNTPCAVYILRMYCRERHHNTRLIDRAGRGEGTKSRAGKKRTEARPFVRRASCPSAGTYVTQCVCTTPNSNRQPQKKANLRRKHARRHTRFFQDRQLTDFVLLDKTVRLAEQFGGAAEPLKKSNHNTAVPCISLSFEDLPGYEPPQMYLVARQREKTAPSLGKNATKAVRPCVH